MAVPEVLMSGHHARIVQWRREQAVTATWNKRPDLIVEARRAGRLSKQWATATPPVTFTDVGSASGGSASGGNASGDAAGATGDNAEGDVDMEGRATPSVAAADGAG